MICVYPRPVDEDAGAANFADQIRAVRPDDDRVVRNDSLIAYADLIVRRAANGNGFSDFMLGRIFVSSLNYQSRVSHLHLLLTVHALGSSRLSDKYRA